MPNPSFEEFDLCNKYFICPFETFSSKCINSCCAAGLPQDITRPNSATHNWWSVNLAIPPTYFNECNFAYLKQHYKGTSNNLYTPRTGKAFILLNTFGIWFDVDTTDFRQYAQIKLNDSLKAGCNYEVSFYALLARYSGGVAYYANAHEVASDGLGIYLSKDSVYTDYKLRFQALSNITPQILNPSGHLLTDSTNYQKVWGLYKAQGGEQWLVIGNFKDNAHTQSLGNYLTTQSNYAVDDVSVTRWRPDLVSFIDTIVCEDIPLTLKLPAGLSSIKWSTGDTTRQVDLLGTGTFTVEASNGCEMLRDTFNIHRRLRYTDTFSIGKDTFFCKIPTNYSLSAPSGFNRYAWSTGANNNSIIISTSGEYWVKAFYECGTLSDTVFITEFQQPDTLLIPHAHASICSDQSLDVQVLHPTNYTSFLWNDGSTLNHLSTDQPGTYSLKATTAQYCEVKDTLNISVVYPPLLNTLSDTIACDGTSFSVVLHPKPDELVQWYDGRHNVSHEFNTTGTYWVSLSNTCYTSTDSMKVDFLDCTLNIPNLVTNNGDGMNDFFIIETKIPRILNLIVYNAWGSEVFKEEDYQGQWGNNAKDGIYFYQITDPLLNKNYKGWLQILK